MREYRVYKDEQRKIISGDSLVVTMRPWNGTSALVCQLGNFPQTEARQIQRKFPLCQILQKNNSSEDHAVQGCCGRMCHNLNAPFSLFKNMFSEVTFSMWVCVCAVCGCRTHMDHSNPYVCTVKRPSVQSVCAGPKTLHIYCEPSLELIFFFFFFCIQEPF